MSLFSPSYPPIDLEQANVLVTGGARGIGRATAEAFVSRGAHVALGDLDHELVIETAEAIGPNASAHRLDVTSAQSFVEFVEAAVDELGPIDVLVNNAGVMPIAAFLDEPNRVSATTLDVNVWGPIHGMRAVLPAMTARRRGHVVNVASLAGKQHVPGLAVYCASKFAVVGLTATVRDEMASSGVSVSAVLPSAVRTELSSGVPMNRALPAVDPEDVARAVVDSVRTRDGEIVVPRWMGPLDRATHLTPAPVMSAFRRMIQADRALTSLDDDARASYKERIEDQAEAHDAIHG